jgi:hypothetical protein
MCRMRDSGGRSGWRYVTVLWTDQQMITRSMFVCMVTFKPRKKAKREFIPGYRAETNSQLHIPPALPIAWCRTRWRSSNTSDFYSRDVRFESQPRHSILAEVMLWPSAVSLGICWESIQTGCDMLPSIVPSFHPSFFPSFLPSLVTSFRTYTFT